MTPRCWLTTAQLGMRAIPVLHRYRGIPAALSYTAGTVGSSCVFAILLYALASWTVITAEITTSQFSVTRRDPTC